MDPRALLIKYKCQPCQEEASASFECWSEIVLVNNAQEICFYHWNSYLRLICTPNQYAVGVYTVCTVQCYYFSHHKEHMYISYSANLIFRSIIRDMNNVMNRIRKKIVSCSSSCYLSHSSLEELLVIWLLMKSRVRV